MSKLRGLPGGLPLVGQSTPPPIERTETPPTRAIIVMDEDHGETSLPLVATAMFTDSAILDFSQVLAPAVAAIVIKELEQRGVIPGRLT